MLFDNRITLFDDSDANENYTPHTHNINIDIEEFSDNVNNLNLDYISYVMSSSVTTRALHRNNHKKENMNGPNGILHSRQCIFPDTSPYILSI